MIPISYHIDIDECMSENGGCSHTCTNSDGSFACSCPSTMILGENGKTCKPRPTTQPPTTPTTATPTTRATTAPTTTAPTTTTTTTTVTTTTPVTPSPTMNVTLTSTSGTFALPTYPSQPYASNRDYIWIIRLQDVSKAITLTFQSRFDIQDSPSCSASYVEVRDGDGPNSMLVGRYCGSTAPSVITSSTNTLYIRFHSSSNQTTNVGFSASYSTIQLPQGMYINSHNYYSLFIVFVFQLNLPVEDFCLHLYSLVLRIFQHSIMDRHKFASF